MNPNPDKLLPQVVFQELPAEEWVTVVAETLQAEGVAPARARPLAARMVAVHERVQEAIGRRQPPIPEVRLGRCGGGWRDL
jgi:hypothetical protein